MIDTRLSPFEDSTEKYIKYLVKREKMLAARLNVVRDTLYWLIDIRDDKRVINRG